MRLQKYISKAGYASRRKAEALISEGLVKVNGIKVVEMGIRVDPDKDSVSINGKILRIEKEAVYLLLNKPEGVVTTLSDNFNRTIVTDFISINERVYPVGRLDYDSKGLVLMTNDGELTNFLTHPAHHISKTYIVNIDRELSSEEINRFRNGVDIGGYVTAKCDISKKGHLSYEIVLYEGKNRQIRRMFETFKRRVLSLQRVSIGNIMIGSLKEGAWRRLNEEEVKYLRSLFDTEKGKKR
ncbi:MAG: rRNA pseudouridine synthase [Peptostreptococcaceae bacterium]|nr:rRNA pseudouridine synthase [Peptostreptococcaceae bacterium]